MKRKFILLHSAGYKTEEVFEKRVTRRSLDRNDSLFIQL